MNTVNHKRLFNTISGFTAEAERRLTELRKLLDLIAETEDELGLREVKRLWLTLTQSQETILALLIKRRAVSRDAMFTVLYGARAVSDRPDPRTIDVFVSQLKGVLRDLGIPILTERAGCRSNTLYWISEKSKQRLRDLRHDEAEAGDNL